MWPDSKGKGGKEGSPKSKDGGGEATKPNAGASGSSSGGKSGGKGRNTKTKMKAIAAENATQQDSAEASAKLEQDIIKAAQGLSEGQAKSEETKTLLEVNRVPDSMVRSGTPETATASSLMRLPETSNDNIDEKISSLWKSRVLGAYRANPRASQHILPAMTANSRGVVEITDKARCDAQQAAMITLIDKMFDSFQNLAFEFNNVAQASDLELTWIRPTISRENISSWHQAAQVISVFTGRISTRRWTMVVRGNLDSVLAYVIPADKLLSFTNQPTNFHPVIELIPTADGLTVRWSALGRVVSQEELGFIYRALLDNMIRIAQDDAPCDCFIDLAAYGVVLGGVVTGQEQFNQTQSQVMGQDISYGAKYQQGFYKDDVTYAELPAASNLPTAGPMPNPFARSANSANSTNPSAAPVPMAQAAESSAGAGSSAGWKPVVHTVRGANPPVPPTLMPGQNQSQAEGQGQGEWPAQPSLPTTPGFNQDEPWKYGSGALPQGQVNPSINSFGSRSGPGSQSIAGGAGGQGRVPGDQNDEPPLPSLPAHLFEGLPPRPQNLPGTGFARPSQGAPNSQAPQASSSSHQGQPSPWSASASAASSSGVSSASSSGSSTSSSDGWKSAGSTSDGWKSTGIPAAKERQSLPPLPVSSYQSAAKSPFMNEPAPLSNSLVSPESFTSGSIRVDALAREIAHSPVSLPAAIPGFEPYSIDEPKAEPPRLRVEAPPQVQATFAQATFDKIDRVLDDPDLDTWPEGSTEAEGKPWPKPRAQSRIEHEVELESEPEPVPAPTIMPQANVEPEIVVVPNAKIEREAGVDVSPEQNAFINFDSEAEVARGAEQDDAEIAALFEGEPVNASDIRDESSKSSRSPGAAPAYIAWLEPIPDAEEPVVFKQKEPVANSQLSQQSITSLPPATEAEHSSAQYIDEPGVNPAMQQHSESLPESTQEQFRQPVIDQLAGQASEQYTTADASQPEIAEEILQVIPQKIVQEVPKEIEQERPSTDRSRAAIEEGFRQAQAAFASTEFEQQPAGEGSYPEPAPPVVPADSAPMTFASSLTSLTSAPSVFGVPAGRSLKADIDRLLGNLDSELEMVSTKGSEAFAKRDLKGAERMIKLAEVLSELKDSLTKLRDEHGQDLS